MYSQFTGMLLKQRKQKFLKRCNIKIPTGRRQTSWLFTKHEGGLELRTADGEANPASGRVEALNLGPPEYSTLNHSAMLPPPNYVTKTLSLETNNSDFGCKSFLRK